MEVAGWNTGRSGRLIVGKYVFVFGGHSQQILPHHGSSDAWYRYRGK